MKIHFSWSVGANVCDLQQESCLRTTHGPQSMFGHVALICKSRVNNKQHREDAASLASVIVTLHIIVIKSNVVRRVCFFWRDEPCIELVQLMLLLMA